MLFTDEEIERYARHLVLREVGGPGQQKLKAASVLIVGMGGLGAPAALYLAAAGVGTIMIADPDVVDRSNLQRQVIYAEEIARYGCARIPDHGLAIGKLLLMHGTPEQIGYHLPRVLSGEIMWCQGYSEPNAGSDLASLRTRADRDGDDLIVNGQKIWTTLGPGADWMFALVRTSKVEGAKQRGFPEQGQRQVEPARPPGPRRAVVDHEPPGRQAGQRIDEVEADQVAGHEDAEAARHGR